MRRFVLVSLMLLASQASAQPPAADDADLTRAAEAFEAAGAMGKAIDARKLLIEHAGTDAARRARSLYRLGMDYLAIAEFEQAASTLERFAAEAPTDADAPDALGNAIVLRLGLRDERRVAEDVERFRKTYGATKPELTAKLDYALAAHESEQGDWASAERDLTGSMSAIDRGPVYLRMCAHALLGKALARHAGDARAAAEYARVRELGASLGPASSDPVELRTYAKGLLALGEATMFDADARRAATIWTHLAPYGGSADDREVDGSIAGKMTPWVSLRSATIAGLEAEYRKVLTIGEYPPPSAVVDASSRVALMWADAADELLSLPVPARWSAEVKKRFRENLAKAATPLTTKAKPAAMACVAYSVKFQWSDAASAGCGAWLTRTYRAEAPPLDELLLPRPLRASGTTPWLDPTAPLQGAAP